MSAAFNSNSKVNIQTLKKSSPFTSLFRPAPAAVHSLAQSKTMIETIPEDQLDLIKKEEEDLKLHIQLEELKAQAEYQEIKSKEEWIKIVDQTCQKLLIKK